jgi:hypothetical protein
MALTKPDRMLIDQNGTLLTSVPDFSWYVDETMKTLDMPRRGEAVIDSFAELKSLF